MKSTTVTVGAWLALVLMAGPVFADRKTPQGTLIRDMESLQWTEKAPGVWSAVAGKAEPLTYLSFAEEPKMQALAKMPAVEFPFSKDATRGLVGNYRTQVRLPLGLGERLYGLGLQFQGMHRRDRIYHLRMDHYAKGTERLHAPVPFYVSSEGYGVLFNSPRFISIYAGVGNRKDSPALPPIRDRNTDPKWDAQPESDAVEACVVSEGMEVLVFAGPTPLDVVRRFNLYCGGGCLPPKWGLGFWARMPTHASAGQIEKEVAEFDRRDIPLDVIGLEPGWHTKSYPCTFQWNDKFFPDPAKFLDNMTEQGIRVNLWENPYISPHAEIYEVIKPHTGSHTVWLGLVPDYTLKEARDILTTQHDREHLALGVSGYKIDEVDGYDYWLWADHATFPSGTSGEVMRQTYALQLQKMLTEMFRRHNRRTYGQVRADNAGGCSYPFVIYSDHYDHPKYITALCNSGLAGVLWTPEIRSAKSSEEWVRRMQSVCFSPLTQLNGWSSKTKPWSFPDVENEIRQSIKLRIRLLPYLYTAFARYHFEGIPPIRPMVLEPGYADRETIIAGQLDGEKNPYAMAVRRDVSDQYMFGDCILVAPMFTGQEQRTVILPKGKWYDFYTGELAGGGQVIEVSPPLDEIPLFVRDGGMVPMMPAVNRISKLQTPVPLEVRVYGSEPAKALLYDDDGVSYDYEKGDYCLQELQINANRTGRVTKVAGAAKSTYGPITWKFMTP